MARLLQRLAACGLVLFAQAAFAQTKPGECPQARLTQSAPAKYVSKRNPYAGNAEAIHAGQVIFQGHADTDACTLCHGKKGDGKGTLAKLYDPPPRNFVCGNTMGAIPEGAWGDLKALRALTNEQLHHLGRIPYPLLHTKGEPGFQRISWDEAIALTAGAMKAADPERLGVFASSRGITNETDYTLQKLARWLQRQK